MAEGLSPYWANVVYYVPQRLRFVVSGKKTFLAKVLLLLQECLRCSYLNACEREKGLAPSGAVKKKSTHDAVWRGHTVTAENHDAQPRRLNAA